MYRIVVLVVAALFGCASVQDTHDQSLTVDAGYDEAWQAAVFALSETGFSVRSSDKDSGVLYAEAGRNIFTQNEPPQLNVLVAEGPGDGQTTITVRAVQAGQIYDWGAGKGNTRKFFDALETRLQ